MASKKEIFKNVTDELNALFSTGKVKPEVQEQITAIINKHLEPKTGGQAVNLDEVTKKDKEGNIVQIQCSLSGHWLPATEDFFYKDTSGGGINGLKRVSKQAYSIRSSYDKTVKASERALMDDMLNKRITPEEAGKELAKIRGNGPDYSGMTLTEVEKTEGDVKGEEPKA